MQIVINTESSIPLFAQLVEQIKQAVKAKKVKAGDGLPSIRQLANDLDINNKTVAKAYKLLERDCVIESKSYRGTFVHPDAINNCEVDLTNWTNKKLENTIKELRKSNVTDSEIRIAFAELMNQ
ncbi:MAG: GntR family transcriptional regulator [Gammaproteobacteria bacterium]|nr:MAG: GntR family transcriptional regulator [Gammaproteobacteria bacterium]